jgi:membrane fusion protein (multidrug efflux system)
MSSSEKPTPQTPAPKPVASPAGGKTPDHPHVATAPAPVPAASSHGSVKRWLVWGIVAVLVVCGSVLAAPWVRRALDTVSTDDAYINSHVTLVAPRVSGQVARVLVDDNNRVRKGDLLVELDKEPFQVEVDVAQAAVAASEADLVVAEAQTRGIEGRTRSLRFNLERSIEDVNNQVAVLQSQKASLAKAQADFERGERTFATKAISKEEFDLRRESMLVAQARVHEALEGVHQVRVSLGLPLEPGEGHDLAHVPPDLDQTFSSVRQAQASLMESAAQLGVNESFTKSPRQLVADFYKRDPKGQIDRIYDELLKNAPALK